MSATPEPRWAEPQSTGWDPFGDNPLAPMPEKRSAVERVQLRLVRAEPAPAAPRVDAHPAPAPAPPAVSQPEAPAAAPAPTPTPAPEPAPAPVVEDEAVEDDAVASADEFPASRLERAQAWVRETWWMPNLLTERPPSVVEVVAYAETGAQHAREDGPARGGSKLWGYLVAAPASAVLYLLAYLIQRPGRAATVGIVAFLAWLAWITS